MDQDVSHILNYKSQFYVYVHFETVDGIRFIFNIEFFILFGDYNN